MSKMLTQRLPEHLHPKSISDALSIQPEINHMILFHLTKHVYDECLYVYH